MAYSNSCNFAWTIDTGNIEMEISLSVKFSAVSGSTSMLEIAIHICEKESVLLQVFTWLFKHLFCVA